MKEFLRVFYFILSKKKIEESLETIIRKENELNSNYESIKNKIEEEKDSNRDAEKAVFRIMAESQEIRLKLQKFT